MIDEITIQKVKAAASIVDVVGRFVELRKKGVNYEGLCPFHDDRHLGNFYVSPAKNICTCFACNCNDNGSLDPIGFLMEHEKLSYSDAIRWLGRMYSIDVEGAEKMDGMIQKCKPREPLPELPMLEIPTDIMNRKRSTDNNLCNFIRSLRWDNAQRARIEEVFNNYLIGTSKGGLTIFWQADEWAKVRTAKMMLYKQDGHRDKESSGNFDWMHSALARIKAIDLNKAEMRQTLYGMHLTPIYPTATINIVESEKTAILMAIAYGNNDRQIWLATGGMNNLTRPKLQPLIERKRHIMLYPDMDAIDKWKERAKLINYNRLSVADDVMKQMWRPEDGEKADIADIIIRMMNPKTPTMEDVIREYPGIKPLHEALKLKVTSITHDK